jgi:hypothetical protein
LCEERSTASIMRLIILFFVRLITCRVMRHFCRKFVLQDKNEFSEENYPEAENVIFVYYLKFKVCWI